MTQQQKTQQTTYPVVVVEVPRQSPPRAWVAHREQDLIDACVPYCDRSGESYPDDAAAALDVLGHDLYALVTVTREEWEAAHACESPAEVLGLPVHQRLAAYSAARDAAAREGWPTADDDAERRARALLGGASWRWTAAPVHDDERAVGGDLVAADGTVLASALYVRGDLDIDSDGCGVMVDGLGRDDIPWDEPCAEEIDAAWRIEGE